MKTRSSKKSFRVPGGTAYDQGNGMIIIHWKEGGRTYCSGGSILGAQSELQTEPALRAR